MSIVAIIVKIMPESPEVDVSGLQEKALEVLEGEGAQNVSFEVKDMAFGLKALFVKFAWPEDKDSSVYEDKLGEMEGVGSVNTEDYRRAFG